MKHHYIICHFHKNTLINKEVLIHYTQQYTSYTLAQQMCVPNMSSYKGDYRLSDSTQTPYV